MTIDLDELERLAKAATGIAGGKWAYVADREDCGHAQHEYVIGPRVHIGATVNGDYFTKDMKHIAAANPATVLALVERQRMLEDLLRGALAEGMGWEDTDWGPKAAKIVGSP